MKTLLLLTVAAIASSPVFAETKRQADSHEHGVGQMGMALEGSKISMELHAPGADIVGFEYEAKSEEDHAAIDAAVAVLSKPFDLFTLPAAAGCKVVEASAELEGDEGHDGHDGHEEDHADHKVDHADHDDHKEDHDDHDEEEAGHTEFHSEYLLECTKPNMVTEISFPYFEAFPNAKELELQIVSEKGAFAIEVERDVPSAKLSGLF